MASGFRTQRASYKNSGYEVVYDDDKIDAIYDSFYELKYSVEEKIKELEDLADNLEKIYSECEEKEDNLYREITKLGDERDLELERKYEDAQEETTDSYDKYRAVRSQLSNLEDLLSLLSD